MRNQFLTNYTEVTFLNKIKDNLRRCKSFAFSDSFIKKAGLFLLFKDIEAAVERGRAPTYTVMLNPEIIKKDGAYDTEEGCLSLLGGPRKCKRYKTIKVQNQTLDMQTRTKNFTGWTAQIIQHKVDHCNRVLIYTKEKWHAEI